MEVHTQHTPLPRVSWEELHEQIVAVKSNVSYRELGAASSANVLILNSLRQIVFITRSSLDLFGIDDPAEAYGCRIGEALQCTHASPNGCGTSPHCQICGAANAIRASLNGKEKSAPYNVTQSHTGEPLNLTIHTIPITLKGQHYILLSLSEQDE